MPGAGEAVQPADEVRLAGSKETAIAYQVMGQRAHLTWWRPRGGFTHVDIMWEDPGRGRVLPQASPRSLA